MTYRKKGYFSDGSMLVEAYDKYGHSVYLMRGFINYKANTITLYPHKKLCISSSDPDAGEKATVRIKDIEVLI